MSERIGIDGREYKLLLDPVAFRGSAYEAIAASFWHNELKPLIDATLAPNRDESRATGALRLKKRRVVIFLDTTDRALDERGVALRMRTAFKNGGLKGLPEVTLKFRTPDLLRAAAYCSVARTHAGKTTLEEDIAPLQVARTGKRATVARPRSTYSRFSVSTKRNLGDSLADLGDVFGSFGALAGLLDGAKNAELHAGPTICEWVFQKARVDLGHLPHAEFGFTIWHFLKPGATRHPFARIETGAGEPGLAEISFDFATADGRMDADAADRAASLFMAMQKALPLHPSATSKTKLALPPKA